MANEDNMAIVNFRIALLRRVLPRVALAGVLASASIAVAQAETYTNENGERMECHQEAVQNKNEHPIAAPLAGAVIGGVVGNQFGGGHGKDAMTAAGAVGGAVAGKKIDENRVDKGGVTYREVCRKVG
jgi:uncharacterized protein YcfJ